MTHKTKLAGAFGIALVVAGLLGPWLSFTLGPESGTRSVQGSTLIVLAFCLVGVGRGLAKESRAMVIPFTLVAAAWIVESPGTALENSGTGGIVEVAWGALIALLGCAVIYASVWFPKPAPSSVAAVNDSGANLA